VVEQTGREINKAERLEIAPGLWLDHRRAAYLERERVLCVSDLHLGYTWAHRYQGQLMPVHAPDKLLERLLDLCTDYQPQTFAFLGDIVHQAVPVSAIRDEFASVVAALRSRCGVQLILGNHDRKLRELMGGELELLESYEAGRYLLIHGNESLQSKEDAFIIMGHEHPAISLGDGVSSAKFPCFMVSANLLILPAFSDWAAGSDIRYHDFMSPLARNTQFEKAVAILGRKLLPIRLAQA
jgi:DNA ligase-associated metallophosphoesterase